MLLLQIVIHLTDRDSLLRFARHRLHCRLLSLWLIELRLSLVMMLRNNKFSRLLLAWGALLLVLGGFDRWLLRNVGLLSHRVECCVVALKPLLD